MKSYFNCYRYRLHQIGIATVATVLVIVICGLLFGKKLKNVSNQLYNYKCSDYNMLYVLNYDAPFDNTCVYPDADISVFLDDSKTKRIAASIVMKKADNNYTLDYLQPLNTISKDQILFPINIREKYGLNVGDTVYIEYPYKSELSVVTIGAITNYEYDYSNPNIANDIGVAFIDTDIGYIENVKSKYILFSDSSQADTLSEYPQIINEIINKGDNHNKVSKQGFSALVFILLLSIGSIFIADYFFFSKSLNILKRLYLKGAKRSSLISTTIAEKTIFGFGVFLITEFLLSLIITINSHITVSFFLIPLTISLVYIIISTLKLSGKLKSKG